jgi:hypothetical protein
MMLLFLSGDGKPHQGKPIFTTQDLTQESRSGGEVPESIVTSKRQMRNVVVIATERLRELRAHSLLDA